MNLSKYIDHTILKPEATKADVTRICEEAIKYQFASVCINPCWISYAKEILKNSNVKIATVIGFPLGATTSEVKAYEAKQAVENGADEVDMVLNVGKMRDGDYEYVSNDIKAVVKASNCLVKVILETCKLTKDEIAKASKIASQSGADFVKTSTGFGGGGATVEDVKIMKENCGNLKVKASGGIRDYETAVKMIEAGAERLGTSASIAIVTNK